MDTLTPVISYDTMFYISELVSGGTYDYHVRVRTGSGWSDYSTPIGSFPLRPGVPILIGDDNPGEKSFVADWNSVPGAGSYEIQVSHDKEFIRILSDWDGITTNEDNIIVDGLESGYGYYYRVRSVAISTDYKSDWSNSLLQYTRPMVPSALPATEIDGYSFLANWSDNGVSEAYLLDVSTSLDFASSSMVHTDLKVYGLYYRVTGLEPLTDYYYRLRSKSGNLVSDDSNPPISVRTLLGVPELLDGVVDDNSITISWYSVDISNVEYA